MLYSPVQDQIDRSIILSKIEEKYTEVYGHSPSPMVRSTYNWLTQKELEAVLSAFDHF